MEHEELTRSIIGSAYTVFNKLGSGFLESVYERALVIELGKAGLDAVCQKLVPVHYEGHLVGEFRVDLLVNDVVIVELKAVERLDKIHEVQLVNYLAATHRPVGLLLNFSPDGVIVRRKIKDRPGHGNSGDHPVDPAILSKTDTQKTP